MLRAADADAKPDLPESICPNMSDLCHRSLMSRPPTRTDPVLPTHRTFAEGDSARDVVSLLSPSQPNDSGAAQCGLSRIFQRYLTGKDPLS